MKQKQRDTGKYADR